MRILMSLMLVLCTQVFAVENGQIMSVEEFNTEYNLDKSASYFPWASSRTTCYAHTVCPNGRRIWCTTYGASYSRVPHQYTNSCRFGVLPGRAVRCQGYVAQRDFYGNVRWGWVDIPVSCY